jgi:hypothetical protein
MKLSIEEYPKLENLLTDQTQSNYRIKTAPAIKAAGEAM